MARRFVTSKEIAFIDSINRELIQHFVQQEIIYYAISVEESEVHDVYDESIKKVWHQPVKLNARVRFDNPSSKSTAGGLDSSYTCEAYCHTAELNERNLKPREGDFIEFGQIIFELTSVTMPQLAFGQANNKIMTKLMGVSSREGQFQIGNISDEGIDNTTPVNHPVHKPLRNS